MSEILIRLNPETGKVYTVELIADDEKSQMDGLESLQFYMKEINQFARKIAERARLYKILNLGEPLNEEKPLKPGGETQC